MRTLPALPTLLAALAVTFLPSVAPAQPVPVQVQPAYGSIAAGVPSVISQPGAAEDPKFDLEFPGGSPELLVDMLAAASGHPVNVIIPEDTGSFSLPSMKLRGVTVPEVFAAITQAGQQTVERDVARSDGSSLRRRFTFGFGFRPTGRPAQDGIWIYFAEPPPPEQVPAPATQAPMPQVDPATGMLLSAPAAAPPEEVRVLNLSPFLQAGRSVEDITTAIRTACDLLPGGGQPKLMFHKETNLLLTRGRPDQLELIEEVLARIQESAPLGAGVAPHRMSPELMRRYGLPPAEKPTPEPATKE